jgi:hypothetical protein
MFVLEYGECGDEFSELAPMCPVRGPLGTAPDMASEPAPARHRTHPLTWIVAAALLPLLCWDAWESMQEAKLRSRTRSAPISQVDQTAGLLDTRHNSH